MEKECVMCRISSHEVSSALEKMKIGKASGPSGVVTEIIKSRKEFEIEWLQICAIISKQKAKFQRIGKEAFCCQFKRGR